MSMDRSSRRVRRKVQNVDDSQLQCDKTYHVLQVPSPGDDITVRWVLGGREVWWPAVVMECTLDYNPPYIANGLIWYQQYQNYKSEVAQVMFTIQLMSYGYDKLIQTMTDNNIVNERELASWLFSDEMAKTKSNSISNDTDDEHDEPNPSSNQLDTCSRNSHSNCASRSHRTFDAQESADNQEAIESDACNVTDLKQESTLFKEKKLGKRKNVTVNTDSSPQRNIFNDIQHHSEAHQKCCSDLANQLRVVHGVVGTLQEKLNNLEKKSCDVMHRLRWLFLKKLQLPFKQHCGLSSEREGMVNSCVSVVTACSLNTFRQIVLNFFNSKNNAEEEDVKTSNTFFKFVPSRESVVSRSLGPRSLHVLFVNFNDICSLLSLKEEDDYEKIICKECEEKTIPYMRIAGTSYVRNTTGDFHLADNSSLDGNNSSGHMFNGVIVGKACVNVLNSGLPVSNTTGVVSNEVTGQGDNHNNSESTKGKDLLQTVFEQDREGWNEDNGTFHSKWTSSRMKLSVSFPDQFKKDFDSQLPNSISFSWYADREPSKSQWSKDVFYTSENVLGSVTLRVPFVLMHGRKTCTAISKLLDKHIEEFIPKYL